MSKLRIVLLSTVCLELSACTQYFNRYAERIDTISFGAGDSVAANEALMVPDPTPRYAYDTNIAFDGERIARAVRIYREGVKEPIETLPDTRKKQFGSKFIDSGSGQPQQQPGPGFFVPVPTETSGGIPIPPPSNLNINQNNAPPAGGPAGPGGN
ncbi:MAG: hypothetical protein WA208_20135 [Thermoanaerobaculia bacterium]